jgi:flavin reductase (DIM6/NTAB) family NADH-FMN oxidoreductase RutF
MTLYEKTDYPLNEIRRHLEPGPVVLVTSALNGQTDIMTMGWHMMLEFTPALFGCLISPANHSFRLIRESRECVINIPTIELAGQLVEIGNSSGQNHDKFRATGLTPVKARLVAAPLIAECYASFECRLYDDSKIDDLGLFVWEVVQAHVAESEIDPKTLHYRGHGQFMTAGPSIDFSEKFKPQNL